MGTAERDERAGPRRITWLVVALVVGVLVGCAAAGDNVDGQGVPIAGGSSVDSTSSDLAQRTKDRSETITSRRALTKVTYAEGTDCPARGAELTESLVARDRSRGWVDVDQDGTIDAIRQGEQLLVASRIVSAWNAPTEWIAVPTEVDDPILRTAISYGPLKSAVGPLLADDELGSVVEQIEQLGGLRTDGGTEVVNGRATTRYDFVSTEDLGFTAAVWVGDDDVVARVETNYGHVTGGPTDQVTEIVGIDEPIAVDVPPEGSTTPLGEIAAEPVLLSDPSSDPACNSPEARTAVEARRACIEEAAHGDLADFVADERQSDPRQPYGCPI